MFSLLTACSSQPPQQQTVDIGVSATPAITMTEALSSRTAAAMTRTPSPAPGVTPTPRSTETMAPTLTPTIIPQPTRTIPAATLLAEATITAFGPICEAPASEWGAETSPDGHWIAMLCRGDNGKVDSHLRVVSLPGDKNWVIHYADYAHALSYASGVACFAGLSWVPPRSKSGIVRRPVVVG
jgi:hypothetical protein